MTDNGAEGWVLDNKYKSQLSVNPGPGLNGNGLVVSDGTDSRRLTVNDLYNNFGRNELESDLVKYLTASPFRILFIEGSADVFDLKHEADKNRAVILGVIKENMHKEYSIVNLPGHGSPTAVKSCRIATKDMVPTGIELEYMLDSLVLNFLGHIYRVNFEKTLTEEEFKKEIKNVVDLINQMLESKEKLKAAEDNELKKLSITLSGMKYK